MDKVQNYDSYLLVRMGGDSTVSTTTSSATEESEFESL
jgi:hypothetical protein